MKSPTSALKDLVIDAWSALSHKSLVADTGRYDALLPTWLDEQQQRRLAAYRTLSAYLENVARFLLRETADEQQDYREYGDAALLVARVVSGILGESIAIVVDGADEDLPDLPALPDPPHEPEAGADELELRMYAIRRTEWERRAVLAIDAWERAILSQPELQARQEHLREWADDELLEQKLWEGEGDAVGLGDAVYVLGISNIAQRVRVRVFGPESYFPVLDDEAEARGFPTRIHLAWGFAEKDTNGTETQYVRRITYELGPIAGPEDADGLPTIGTRVVPYQAEPARETCYLSDAVWRLEDLRTARGADGFRGAGTFQQNEDGDELDRLDLGIDFIPIIHVPNTPADREHFGRALLSRVLQLLDDLASTDTDMQAAAALAGSPMVALSGSNATGDIEVKPGLVVGVGTDGSMDVIDLSASITALDLVLKALLDRLEVNAQVPGEVTGRVEDTGAESGFARSLKFGPYNALIAVYRLVREHKYRLMLKFEQRLAMAAGFLEAGEVHEARIEFGSFLPDDVQSVVTVVKDLLTAKAISRRTAIVMLVTVGIPIEDAQAELDAIQSEDFAGAQALFEATADDDATRAYLKLPPGEGRPEAEPQPDPAEQPEPAQQ